MDFFKKFRLSSLPRPDGLDFDGTQKQNIVLSKLALLTVLVTAIHLIDEAFTPKNPDPNYKFLILVESLLICFSLITYIVNEFRYHDIAKHIFLLSVNILLFFLNTLTPTASGSYFFFFPLMAGTFIFYGYSETFKRYFYLVLTCAIFVVLTVFDYNILGMKVEMDVRHDFITNLLSSLMLMVLTIGYLIKLNKQTETNLLNYQYEIKKLLKEVKDKNVNLEKVNKELDRFAYCVSHELRAPLVSVMGLINLSMIDTSPKNHQIHLKKMTEMLTKLDVFIHDIGDHSRNAKSEVMAEEFDVKKAINEIVEKYQYNGYNKIDFQISYELDKPFISDATRVKLILNNLISNAVKYHNEEIEKPFVRVRASTSNGSNLIEVTDNGLGIESEYQPKVFDMFYRASESSKGSGLGLYIVKETVEKLGGEIKLESIPGVGSKFKVTI